MFHMSANVPCFVGCSTHRLVSHGDAPSRGQHRPGDFIDRNSLSNPSNLSDLSSPSLRGPRDLGNPNNLSLSNNPSNPGNPSNFGSPSNRSNGNISAPSDPRNLSNQ